MHRLRWSAGSYRPVRKLCVEERGWLSAHEFEDGISATNLLPGPASTQLAILCAWRLRGRVGGLIGGICFIVPGLAIILALSAVFLAAHPPLWILGAAAGAGGAVPAVALNAALGLIPASWGRTGANRALEDPMALLLRGRWRLGRHGWSIPGDRAVGLRSDRDRRAGRFQDTSGRLAFLLFPATSVPVVGGLAALCWVAFKVGALSYGGGFVIIPLMQHDAVVTYHWMTGAHSRTQSPLVKSLRGRSSKRWQSSAMPPLAWAAVSSLRSLPSPRRSASSSAGRPTSTAYGPISASRPSSPGPAPR